MMQAIPFFRDNFAVLKRTLRQLHPEVGSSHADEALASAAAFNTHAALLRAFEAAGERKQVLVALDLEALLRRLAELGYRDLDAKAVEIAFYQVDLPHPTFVFTDLRRLRGRHAANQN